MNRLDSMDINDERLYKKIGETVGVIAARMHNQSKVPKHIRKKIPYRLRMKVFKRTVLWAHKEYSDWLYQEAKQRGLVK